MSRSKRTHAHIDVTFKAKSSDMIRNNLLTVIQDNQAIYAHTTPILRINSFLQKLP